MVAGEPLPAFSLPDQEGRLLTPAAFRGHPLVLYFYPRASTSGCTREAQEFRDHYAKFRRHGVAVVGASPDTVAAQKKFALHESLPFPLLADAGRALCHACGVVQTKTMYGRKFLGVVRTTLLVDGAGTVRRVLAPVKPAGHAAEVLQALRELRLI